MIDKIKQTAEAIDNEIRNLSYTIYQNPELGNQEFKSSKLHMDLLVKYGFTVIPEYLGVKTGFRAEYKSNKEGPTVCFMAEYDALPGIGHGCGHNILGATSTGAGIVLKSIIDEIGGTVVVLGTPAEETNGAKVVYSDYGAFDDITVALESHPSNHYRKCGSSLAIQPLQYEFFGKTAHAASSPTEGINALDAAINTFNNLNALRQQIRSDARVHGIIADGGKAANVIPDYAKVQFYARATTKAYLDELVEMLNNCARGASLAARTELKISNFEYSNDNLITNQAMLNAFCDSLVNFTDEKIYEYEGGTGSTDVGNVSHKCPTIHPYFSITQTKKTGHSKEFADATITEYAYEQMKNTVCALALTAVKVITDKELLNSIIEEFQNAEK